MLVLDFFNSDEYITYLTRKNKKIILKTDQSKFFV